MTQGEWAVRARRCAAARPYSGVVGFFLATFTCERCGLRARRVDRDDAPARTLCASCSDELTAEAAAKHDTLLWFHRR